MLRRNHLFGMILQSGTAEVEKASAEKRWSEALTGAEKLTGEFARISARWNLVRTLQDWAEIHILRRRAFGLTPGSGIVSRSLGDV